MIMGFALLAIYFFKEDGGMTQMEVTRTDFETILPHLITRYVPSGLAGLLLAGLLAAFMSTFASTVNAAPAYIVNDIYLKYINPKASVKTQIRSSYVISVAVVVVSTVIGFFLKDINEIFQWIVGALFGGYIAANVLKWHWWRFNGEGYFWGNDCRSNSGNRHEIHCSRRMGIVFLPRSVRGFPDRMYRRNV